MGLKKNNLRILFSLVFCILAFVIFALPASSQANNTPLTITANNETVEPSQEVKLQITLQSTGDLSKIQVEVARLNPYLLIANNKQEIDSLQSGESRTVQFNVETSKYAVPGTYQLNYSVTYHWQNSSYSLSNNLPITIKEASAMDPLSDVIDVKIIIGLIIGLFITLIGNVIYNRLEKHLKDRDSTRKLQDVFIAKSKNFTDELSFSLGDNKTQENAKKAFDELKTALVDLQHSSHEDTRRKVNEIINKSDILTKVEELIKNKNNVLWRSFREYHARYRNKEAVPHPECHELFRNLESYIEDVKSTFSNRRGKI